MDDGAPLVSVVLPVHNERESVGPLVAELRAALAAAGSWEIVAVDDASTDGSREELVRLAALEPGLRVLALRRRGGQSAALLAGWRAARGEVVVTLDADGQNDPADVPRLLTLLADEPALTAVVGVRVRRRDRAWKRLQGAIANRVRDLVTGHRVRDTGCGLKAVRRAALLRVPPFDGMHRFLPTLLVRDGGTVREAPVAHRPRRFGRTKYGMWNRAFRGLRDAVGVRWLLHRRVRADFDEVR